MISAHKLEVEGYAQSCEIRPDVMDELCKWIKKTNAPSGYTWFGAITKKHATAAEVSYIKLFGYCVTYTGGIVNDYRISWGVERR